MKRQENSPIKDRPLRNPGQSLEEELDDLIYDRVLWPLLIAVFVIVLAGLEWWNYFHPHPPAPIIYSVLACAGVAYAAVKIWRAWPRLRALRQGRDGEKVVGQFLERQRERGYQVFHDVIGDGFNVDHVLIGPAGVLTVETKTRSKPQRGARISFDGERILVAGFEPDRDPIVQSKAQAAWLRRLLAESTGKQFSVRPVILFPGWFIEQSDRSTRELWVLEPRALPAFLEQAPNVLSAEDVKLASFHLSRFIRTQERARTGRR